MIIGPHRVFPGRLSVSRTIGDIEAKDVRYGGNPKCVIPTPEIKSFKIRNNYDFIILACDGVFEKMDNKQVMNAAWDAARVDYVNDDVVRKNIDPNALKSPNPISLHQKAGLVVDKVLHECVFSKTLDNITAVMIAFDNFEKVTNEMGTGPENVEMQNYILQRRSLEAVPEEFIESEPESAVEFPQVNKNDQSTLSNNKLGNEKLSKTQPIQNLKQEVGSYNTINTSSIVNKS